MTRPSFVSAVRDEIKMSPRPHHTYAPTVYWGLSTYAVGLAEFLTNSKQKNVMILCSVFIFQKPLWYTEGWKQQQSIFKLFSLTVIHHPILTTYYTSAFVDTVDVKIWTPNKCSKWSTRWLSKTKVKISHINQKGPVNNYSSQSAPFKYSLTSPLRSILLGLVPVNIIRPPTRALKDYV